MVACWLCPFLPSWFYGGELETFVTALMAAALLAALLAPRLGAKRFARAERALGRLARRRVLAAALVGLAALALRAGALPWRPVPYPAVHDEFCYLLMADTFAAGRLTNPTHGMWVHFEAPHLNHHPTYTAKYPPAPGLVLAFGQLLGRPWIGVWLSAGLMCAAVTWALQGWFSPSWALWGGAMAAVQIGALTYFMDSYWGGALAAAGGALVVGAVPRLFPKTGWRSGAAFGLGLAVLANTRPYEGLMLALPLGAAVLWFFLRRQGAGWRALLRRVVAPAAAVLLPVAAWMGYYNWRVTGGALTLPYTVNRATYGVAPYFVWQEPRPEPSYRHESLRDFYAGWEKSSYEELRTVPNLLVQNWQRLGRNWAFYIGPLLTLPLLLSLASLRGRRVRILFGVLLFFALALSVEVWVFPHYTAPMATILFALVVQGARRLRLCRVAGRPFGRQALRMLTAACLIWLLVCLPRPGQAPPGQQACEACKQDRGNASMQARARILGELRASSGRHLVLVSYGKNHRNHEEWVYNRAGIDDAPVVWAHEMSPAQNRKLIRYFRNRKVWRIEPDQQPRRLTAWDGSAGEGASANRPQRQGAAPAETAGAR